MSSLSISSDCLLYLFHAVFYIFSTEFLRLYRYWAWSSFSCLGRQEPTFSDWVRLVSRRVTCFFVQCSDPSFWMISPVLIVFQTSSFGFSRCTTSWSENGDRFVSSFQYDWFGERSIVLVFSCWPMQVAMAFIVSEGANQRQGVELECPGEGVGQTAPRLEWQSGRAAAQCSRWSVPGQRRTGPSLWPRPFSGSPSPASFWFCLLPGMFEMLPSLVVDTRWEACLLDPDPNHRCKWEGEPNGTRNPCPGRHSCILSLSHTPPCDSQPKITAR